MTALTSTNIVGSASPTTWSQAQTISYAESNQLLIVLQLRSHDSESIVDLATVGTEMLLEIERLGKQVQTAEHLTEMAERVTREVSQGLQVHLIAGLCAGGTLTLYGLGHAIAYLARNEQLAKLYDTSLNHSALTGKLEFGDRIVLASASFVDSIGTQKFHDILIEEEGPAELLAPLVHTQADSSGIAAIVASVEPDSVASSEGWLSGLFKRDIHVALPREEPRKLNLLVGGVILCLLILMIGIGMVRRVKVVAERDFLTLSMSINSKLDEAVSVGDLNPERARVVLTQARGEVEAYIASEVKDEYRLKAEQLLGAIESTEEKAFKKNDIKLATIVELPILAEGMQATKMKSDGKGNLLFIDTQVPRIISMNLVDRSRQIMETDRFVDIGVSDTRTYGLSKQGVTELLWKKDETKQVIEPDEFWQDPTKLELFAGNVYILDKGQSEIWKYPTLGDTFGGRRRWLAAGITLDLSNVVDMKVVGDIWLLTSSGKLERYSRGAPVTFSMEGFPAKEGGKKLSDPSAVFVTESLIYVLENGANRVVVFDEDGKYQSQYVNTEFARASDLVVVDSKGYVLVDNTVKEFAL